MYKRQVWELLNAGGVHIVPAHRAFGHLLSVQYDICLLYTSDSLHVLTECYVEKYLAEAKPLDYLQFQRIGYFNVDKDSTPEHLVLSLIHIYAATAAGSKRHK